MTRPLAATVATRVFEPEGSAAAYRLGALVRSLEQAGYQTTVLTTRSSEDATSSAKVRRWPVLRDRTGSVRGYLQYASFDIPLFFRLLFGPRADVVIAEPPPTTGVITRVACMLRRTPYAYFSADVTSAAVAGMGASRFVVAAVRVLERWALRGASAVLAISSEVRNEVIDLGADPARVVVVGTGIDTEKFSRLGPKASVDYPYFVYAGTMSEFQGAEVFVSAFMRISDRYPTAQLKMFGSGVEVGALKERSRSLAHRIDFPGTVLADEIAPWLRGATASLASIRPERGYDFALPTKTLASISCGVPVIYSGVGPFRKIILENSLGWSRDWDTDQVASAMAEALDRGPTVPNQRLSEWVETNFSLRAVAERAVAAIGKVIHLP
ncbi:MAG: glycosyltransferase [Terrimesophilobacter sp.]